MSSVPPSLMANDFVHGLKRPEIGCCRTYIQRNCSNIMLSNEVSLIWSLGNQPYRCFGKSVYTSMKYIMSLVAVFMASCQSSENATAHQTDYQLCYGIAKYPTYNVWTESRKSQIKKRGVDCRDYESQVNNQINAEKIAKAGAPVNRNYTYVQKEKPRRQVVNNNYYLVTCSSGRVMTSYGCRYR